MNTTKTKVKILSLKVNLCEYSLVNLSRFSVCTTILINVVTGLELKNLPVGNIN